MLSPPQLKRRPFLVLSPPVQESPRDTVYPRVSNTQGKEVPAVTKKELARQISSKLNVDQVLVKQIIQSCLDGMVDTILDKGRLELRNFGVFTVKQRAARKARNPRTNVEVLVPAKRVITFQAGKNVYQKLQNSPAQSE